MWSEDPVDVGVGDGVPDDDVVGRDVDLGAGDREHAAVAGRIEARHELALVGEDRELVAVDHVEAEHVGVEERRRPGARDDRAGVDVLDVSHRTCELAVDLRTAEAALVVLGHVVHHRVPDRAGVLQPVQVDRAVGSEGAEIGGATVVLVDEARLAVVHHHRRVAARTVGDRRLDVDRHGEAGSDLELLAVDGADELGEPECSERALLLARGVPGQQDRDVAAQVLQQPRLVVMIAVQVRDVEEVGVLDPLEQIVTQLVVAREHVPRTEEGGYEPRIAQDRPTGRLDEDARMADRRRTHDRGG